MKRSTAGLLFVFVTALAHADGPSLSANPYAPDSTSNPYGIYGSPYSPVSAGNPYGQGIQLTAPHAVTQAAPIINVWAAPEPSRPHDFSGLSRLEFQNGHPVISADRPAAPVEALTEAAPEPHENIIDALDEIRRGSAR